MITFFGPTALSPCPAPDWPRKQLRMSTRSRSPRRRKPTHPVRFEVSPRIDRPPQGEGESAKARDVATLHAPPYREDELQKRCERRPVPGVRRRRRPARADLSPRSRTHARTPPLAFVQLAHRLQAILAGAVGGFWKAGPGCVRSIDHSQRPSSGPSATSFTRPTSVSPSMAMKSCGRPQVRIAVAGAGPGETRAVAPSPSPALCPTRSRNVLQHRCWSSTVEPNSQGGLTTWRSICMRQPTRQNRGQRR